MPLLPAIVAAKMDDVLFQYCMTHLYMALMLPSFVEKLAAMIRNRL